MHSLNIYGCHGEKKYFEFMFMCEFNEHLELNLT